VRAGDPIEEWEELVRQRASAGKRGKAASCCEQGLRVELSDELQSAARLAEDEVVTHPIHRRLGAMLEAGGVHLVSLNFDGLAYAKLKVGKSWPNPSELPNCEGVRDADARNLYQRKVLVGRQASETRSMIWHPHGSVDHPAAIRIGLRDYGLQPYAYAKAFEFYKEWERQVLRGRSRNDPLSLKQHKILLEELRVMDLAADGAKPKRADHWITRFMLLPVDFIGVGLSAQEIGLRWLLNQRARNLERIRERQAPVIHRVASEWISPAWADSRFHPDWDAAWDQVLDGTLL